MTKKKTIINPLLVGFVIVIFLMVGRPFSLKGPIYDYVDWGYADDVITGSGKTRASRIPTLSFDEVWEQDLMVMFKTEDVQAISCSYTGRLVCDVPNPDFNWEELISGSCTAKHYDGPIAPYYPVIRTFYLEGLPKQGTYKTCEGQDYQFVRYINFEIVTGKVPVTTTTTTTQLPPPVIDPTTILEMLNSLWDSVMIWLKNLFSWLS